MIKKIIFAALIASSSFAVQAAQTAPGLSDAEVLAMTPTVGIEADHSGCVIHHVQSGSLPSLSRDGKKKDGHFIRLAGGADLLAVQCTQDASETQRQQAVLEFMTLVPFLDIDVAGEVAAGNIKMGDVQNESVQ